MCSQFYCCKLFTSEMLNHETEVSDGTGMKPTAPMLPESSLPLAFLLDLCLIALAYSPTLET